LFRIIYNFLHIIYGLLDKGVVNVDTNNELGLIADCKKDIYDARVAADI
jgi:hypothetical protein